MRTISFAVLASFVTIAAQAKPACPPCIPANTGPCVVTDPTNPERNYCEKGFDLKIDNGEVSIIVRDPEAAKRLNEKLKDK